MFTERGPASNMLAAAKRILIGALMNADLRRRTQDVISRLTHLRDSL
jgi:hypothetical protein